LLCGSQVGMLTYEQRLKQISSILWIIADGIRDMATTAEDEQPLDPSVLEFFGTIEDAARGASEVADELPGLFRAAHEVELERLEAHVGASTSGTCPNRTDPNRTEPDRAHRNTHRRTGQDPRSCPFFLLLEYLREKTWPQPPPRRRNARPPRMLR